jgi:hypothetical protein
MPKRRGKVSTGTLAVIVLVAPLMTETVLAKMFDT